MVSFGLGDLHLLVKWTRRFINAYANAKEDFRDLDGDIDGFREGLEVAKRRFETHSTNFDARGVKAINRQIDRAGQTMVDAHKRIEPYRAALSKRQRSEKPSMLTRIVRKCRWAFSMGGKVEWIRERMHEHRQSVSFISMNLIPAHENPQSRDPPPYSGKTVPSSDEVPTVITGRTWNRRKYIPVPQT